MHSTNPTPRPARASGASVAADPQLDTENGGIEDGSNSFLLVLSASPLSEGFDYDADDDGALDALPAGAQLLDAVAFNDGGACDRLYGVGRVAVSKKLGPGHGRLGPRAGVPRVLSPKGASFPQELWKTLWKTRLQKG